MWPGQGGWGELTPSALPRTEGFSVLLNCLIADNHKGAILNCLIADDHKGAILNCLIADDHEGAILNDDSVIDLFTNKGV